MAQSRYTGPQGLEPGITSIVASFYTADKKDFRLNPYMFSGTQHRYRARTTAKPLNYITINDLTYANGDNERRYKMEHGAGGEGMRELLKLNY